MLDPPSMLEASLPMKAETKEKKENETKVNGIKNL